MRLVFLSLLLLSLCTHVYTQGSWNLDQGLFSNITCPLTSNYKILRIYTSACPSDGTDRSAVYDLLAESPALNELCSNDPSYNCQSGSPYLEFQVAPANVANDVADTIQASGFNTTSFSVVSAKARSPGGSGKKGTPFWVWIIVAVGAVVLIGAIIGIIVYFKFIRPRGKSDMWNSARAMWGNKNEDSGGGLRMASQDHDVYNNI